METSAASSDCWAASVAATWACTALFRLATVVSSCWSDAFAESSLAAAATRRARAESCFLRRVWIDSAEAAAAWSSTTTAHAAATSVRVLVVRIRERSHPPRASKGKCEAERYLFRPTRINPLPRRTRPLQHATNAHTHSRRAVIGHETARGTSRWCRTSPNDITDPHLGPRRQGTARDH